MKVRSCWVSNSSSSSFVGIGWEIDAEALNLICDNIPEMHWIKNAVENFEDSVSYDGISLKRLYPGDEHIMVIDNVGASKELISKLNHFLGYPSRLNAVIWGDD